MRKLYVDGETALRACLANPPGCNRDALLARFEDPARADVAEIVDDSRSKGILTRSPGADKDYYVIEDIVVSDDLTVATVQSCTYDGRVQYIPASGGGAETIVDADVSSYRQTWDFIRAADSNWHVGTITLTNNFKYKDKNVCPAAQ